MRGFQILHHHASLASSLNCPQLNMQHEPKTICEGVYHFMWHLSTPLNFALHISSCHVIMHHIAHCIYLYWFVLLLSLYALFGSSRVDADAEQYEQEYEFPLEDRVGASTSDLTAEPTPSPILHFTCSFDLLLSLCCDSVVSRVLSTCFLYLRDTPPLPTYCLMIASFASRRRV